MNESDEFIASSSTLHVDYRQEVGELHPTAPYVETYWLPVLGPTCIVTARRLSWLYLAEDGPFDIDVEVLSMTLGLGARRGRNTPMVKTLQRLRSFGVAHVNIGSYVLHGFPHLSARHLRRLPAWMLEQHEQNHPHAAAGAE